MLNGISMLNLVEYAVYTRLLRVMRYHRNQISSTQVRTIIFVKFYIFY